MINHIAFIMDGNRRFSKKENISKKEGYKAGMEQFFNFVKFQVKYNIYETSFFALSIDNYKKRDEDLKPIGDLIKEFFNNEEFEKYFEENKVFIELKGDIEELEYLEKIKQKIFFNDFKTKLEKYNKKIKDDYKFKVNIALNYDGQREILQSFKEIIKKIKKGEIKEKDIDEDLIKKYINFSNSKPPEIIVRPGNAPRISGFMLWDSKYSEIYLTKKLWPELNEDDFLEIINWYKNIERNFGK